MLVTARPLAAACGRGSARSGALPLAEALLIGIHKDGIMVSGLHPLAAP